MKIVYFILLFFFSFENSFSQESSAYVFHLNKLPAEGVLLDKGWKFHVGDNPDYAKPGYDDSNWESIDPTLDVHDSLPQIAAPQICWFRLHLLVDSNLLNQQLALIIHQSGASEIYLNGRLIHKYGLINSNPKKIKAYDPSEPVSFPLNKNIKQVLAVRYQLQPNVLYTNLYLRTNPAIQISVNQIDNSIDQYQNFYESEGWYVGNIIIIGAFFILAILHLAFFLYYPPQKANLYFCLFSLSVLLYAICGLNNAHDVKHIFYFSNLSLSSYQLGTFFLLTALYFLLEQKRGWIYWGLLAAIIIGMFLNGWGYPPRWLISVFFISNLVNIEMVRIAFKVLKLKKRGAWIIAAGAINFSIFWIAFITEVIFNYQNELIGLTAIGALTSNVAILSIPVATSVYLGLDFAFTNRSLQQKLVEIEKLSHEKLEMEKKKQVAQIEAMVATQEQERKRISRDLHDDVGTKLSALNLFLSSLDEKAKCTNNNEIRSLTQSSRQFIKETMHDVRQLLLNLSPTVLEEFGFVTAVEGLVNKINETKQIHFDLIVFGMNHHLKKEYELALYRITQELINNVLKHAEAKQVSLQIGQRDEKIILMMEDDGKGFDINVHKDGYGLNNLDARTKLMQGTMIIDSRPGKGTSVLIEIPYNFNRI